MDVEVYGWAASREELDAPSCTSCQAPPSATNRYRKTTFMSQAPLGTRVPAFAVKLLGPELTSPFRNTERQVLAVYQPGVRYVLETVSETGAPFGQHLRLHIHTTLWALSPDSCGLLFEYHMQWLPTLPMGMKGFLEPSVRGAVRDAFHLHFKKVMAETFPGLQEADPKQLSAQAECYQRSLTGAPEPSTPNPALAALPTAAAAGAAAPVAARGAPRLQRAPRVTPVRDRISAVPRAVAWYAHQATRRAALRLLTLLIGLLAVLLRPAGRTVIGSSVSAALAMGPGSWYSTGLFSAVLPMVWSALGVARSYLVVQLPPAACTVIQLLLVLLVYETIKLSVCWIARRCRRTGPESAVAAAAPVGPGPAHPCGGSPLQRAEARRHETLSDVPVPDRVPEDDDATLPDQQALAFAGSQAELAVHDSRAPGLQRQPGQRYVKRVKAVR